MLEPALVHKDELLKLFTTEMYTERLFYYIGYGYDNSLPVIEPKENSFQYAIVDIDKYTNKKKVLGYLAYSVDPTIDCVDRFGLFSFDDGNVKVISDTYAKLEELVEKHHRVSWRMIDGNHAGKGYESFCKKHGGTIYKMHDVTIDCDGNYRDEYVYEIINPNRRIRNKYSSSETLTKNE